MKNSLSSSKTNDHHSQLHAFLASYFTLMFTSFFSTFNAGFILDEIDDDGYSQDTVSLGYFADENSLYPAT